ncbi:hypothetical protein IQ06DRAFT_296995 [Phaeosphaeriaceae sp. SRC1lsM3a]|nr:hypothetical protein IQ06DRAFT_296995 [Stagonospora sp. SRC1lsM3a]
MKNIQGERDGLQNKKKRAQDRNSFVVEAALRPYSDLKGMRFKPDNDESLSRVLLSMFCDAKEANDLRIEVHGLRTELAMSSRKEASQDLQQARLEIKGLREVVHVLQEKNQEMGEVQDKRQRTQNNAGEITILREEIQRLQKDALAKVDKVRPIPDAQFAGEFHAMIAMIRSLSRSAYDSDDADAFSAFGDGVLLRDVPAHRWKTRAQKKSSIEAWMWSALIELVFATPSKFSSDQSDPVHQVWCGLFDARGHCPWPAPSIQSETWRCSTMKQVVELAGRSIITLGQYVSPQVSTNSRARELQETILRSRAELANTVESLLIAMAPTADTSQIQELVDKAFTLAMEMSLQRPRLQVVYPEIGADFDKTQMHAIPDRSIDDMQNGTVAFVVNPGLVKWGDAEGHNLDCRYDIIPSLVQLEPILLPETEKRMSDEAVVVKNEQDLIRVELEDHTGDIPACS